MRPLTVAVVLLAAPVCAAAQASYPGAHWDTIAGSSAARWSVDSLRAIGRYVEALGSGAVVVIDGGRLVAQWGEPARKFPLASARKSLLNALIGIEVGRGTIRTGATLASIGIDDDPPLTPAELEATVADLLRSRSGVYHASAYEPASMESNRPARGSAKPGERWFYNNWDFNALGTIYERASGKGIFDAFGSEIARPLGMEDYAPRDGEYVRESTSRHAAYTFRMSARDLARFVLLYLRGGRWNDRQLVPAEWVAESTRGYSNAADGGAYAQLWWAAREGQLLPGVSLDSGTFAARGNGPHYAIAIPSRKLVIIHLANTDTPSPANWVERGDVGKLVARILAARRPD
ncbi:MAG TPA: serine hydrolase [Gemmatimonadaceae bacterium]|nr:serine hydrolase [Gemmatimonadaceae bacterium]